MKQFQLSSCSEWMQFFEKKSVGREMILVSDGTLIWTKNLTLLIQVIFLISDT